MRDSWDDEGVGCLALLAFVAGMWVMYYFGGGQ